LPTQDWYNPEQVDEYAAQLERGDNVKPIQAVKTPDGRKFILDGHHRYLASQKTGIPVEVNVREGVGPVGLSSWDNVKPQAPPGG